MAATYEAIIALVGQMDPSLKKVTDQAKKELEALEKKAGKSSKGFGKDGLLGKAMKGFGTVAKKALKAAAVGTAAAASGVAVLAKQSLDAYANYEQLVGGVDTLFKGSSKQVQDYANAAYKTAGLSANNYMQTVTSFSASLINSLGGDTAKAADMADMAVTDMADNANKMGTPIEDIQRAYQSLARGQYGMLDNLKLGFGGTKGEMEKLIAKANEYEKANGRAGDLSIDKFSDVVQAIHDVQEEMGITGTTALEASTTIEGSVNSMKAAWENWLTGLANEDADLGGLTDQLLDSVQTVASNVMPRLQTILSRLGSWLAERGPEIMQQLVTGLASAVTTLIPVGAQVLMSLAQGIVASAPMLFTTGFQLLIYLAQGVAMNIPTLITMAAQLIAQFAQACTAYLPTLIAVGAQALVNLVMGIAQNLPSIAASAGQILVALAQGIAQGLPILIQNGPQIIMSLIQGIIGAAGELLSAGWQIVQILGQAILDALGSIGSMIGDFFVSLFTGQPVEAPEIDTSATEASLQSVPDAAQTAADQTSSAFSNISWDIPEAPDIELPDTSGMSMDFSGLSASASGEVSNVNSILSGIGSGASVTVGSADFSPITQAAQAAADNVRNTFTNLGSQVTSALSSGTAGAGNSFTAIVTSAQSAATSVTAAFTGVGAGIGAAIAAALAGASSGFASFAAQGTSSAMQVMSAQSAAAMMVMSLWTMALTMVSSRALATVSAFFQMSAAGTSAAGAISGSMSGVAGNISSITSAAYAAVGALNAMASAARSASAAAASASAAKAVGFAHGGFTSGPSVAGEDPRYPTEAVISFNPAYRAQNKGYVMRAAQMLGMSARAVAGLDKDPWTLGGELANSGAPITSNLEMTTTVNVGGITFAPQIEIKGNASRDDIIAALRKVEPEFAELVRDVVAENEVGDYAFDAT